MTRVARVFASRRAYKLGFLEDCGSSGVKLLPVQISGDPADAALSMAEAARLRRGAVHMEFPGNALLPVEGTPSAESLRVTLEDLLR